MSQVSLFNTLSREVENFQPLQGHDVKLYTCGLTVYSHPHIGNWVIFIYWDVLVRMLRASDYTVTHVQNITDVGHLTSDADAGEDKMLVSALKEGKSAWDVAKKYMAVADHEAYELLALTRPTQLPRATDYIKQQVEFITALEELGYTYTLADGVYYDTSKFKDYSKLARLDIKGLQFGARVADTGKKNPTDFALWKFSPKDQKRDMEWDSPWGKGFPGWHIECSALAREFLGDQIDIHTGGIDHIPVHHTNEIAQTEALTKKQFSQFWVHGNHIKVDGTKMSKSLGNIYTLEDLSKKGYDYQAFKLMVLGKHYRTEGNFTWEILEAAQNRLQRWQAAADSRWQTIAYDEGLKQPTSGAFITQATAGILSALQADLDTPQALLEVEKVISNIDQSGLLEIDLPFFENFLEEIQNLLGINLLQPDISTAQKELLQKRQIARDNKEWETADTLRVSLEESGLVIRDGKQGQVWSRKQPST